MEYQEAYKNWKENPFFNAEIHQELEQIEGNDEEIQDRFYQELHFGTAGLRGKLGAGTNRMNIYTVAKATEGFARMLEEEGEEAKKRGVVIGYDIRHKSKEFAEITAGVFAAHGIHVFLHPHIVPTPVVSYSIRKLSAYAGVMITASHNPKIYNGYKAYGSQGSQILDDWANRIEEKIGQVEDYASISCLQGEEALEKGILEYVPSELMESYYQDVLSLTIHEGEALDKDICLVYSPLNGCGNLPVRNILKERGFHNVHVVKEQENPDPDFTTVGYPNPEDPQAFRLSEKLGKEVSADILLATDPDSDRLALEVKNEQGDYVFLNGNRIGALLIYYIVTEKAAQGTLPKKGAIIKSIVTGDISKAIAREYGLTVFETLTGFKNIAKPANDWDSTGEYDFLFGYEESIGFNHGPFVRDKDAVSSSMLVAEMAAFYKKKGLSLLQVLDKIYQHYGYYNEKLQSVVLEGLDGSARIQRIMDDFRAHPIQEVEGIACKEITDYQKDDTGLPKSNVLKYHYEDGSWYAIRPSGTEPKIKVYIYTKSSSKEGSEKKIDSFFRVIEEKMKEVK